jgi:hypothetical protein
MEMSVYIPLYERTNINTYICALKIKQRRNIGCHLKLKVHQKEKKRKEKKKSKHNTESKNVSSMPLAKPKHIL